MAIKGSDCYFSEWQAIFNQLENIQTRSKNLSLLKWYQSGLSLICAHLLQGEHAFLFLSLARQNFADACSHCLHLI
jgi:hypothetical protein